MQDVQFRSTTSEMQLEKIYTREDRPIKNNIYIYRFVNLDPPKI
jgi:hypothetical protein